MSNIVEVVNDKPFTTTLAIAEGVGIQHKNVMELLTKYRCVDILSTFQTSKVSRGGRPVTFALLDEIQATFVITLMRNSHKVVEFKALLTKEFYRQREIIAALATQHKDREWLAVRKDGKLHYHKKTSVVKQFVDYATAQGSKNSKFYYSNLATIENKALFIMEQKYKNVREILDIRQLMQVSTADMIVEKALSEAMDRELPYKDCYKYAKDKLICFSVLIGRTPVQGLITNRELTP